jgi:hypothetical protein
MDMKHAHVAWTCSRDMQLGCMDMDMQQGRAGRTCSVDMRCKDMYCRMVKDMQHGHSAYKRGVDMQHGNTAFHMVRTGTCSWDMRLRYAAWKCRMSMLHACVHNHVA